MTLRINTGGLENYLGLAPTKIKRVLRNSLNDTARDLRSETPSIISRAVNSPTKFSLRKPDVERADYSQSAMHATVSIGRIQSSYMSHGEFGGTSKNMNQPIRGDAEDRSGNIRKKYWRSGAARARLLAEFHTIRTKRGTRTVKKFFEGIPRGGKTNTAGIFFRTRDLKAIQRVSKYVKSYHYSPRFGIVKDWKKIGTRRLNNHLHIQAARPENRM